MIQLQKKSAKHLVSAYNQMLKQMREAFDRVDQDDISLQQALDQAKHEAVHLGEVTAEEAHEIGEYIKQDVNDAAEHLMDSSSEFYDWLMLDIEVIEQKVIDLFLTSADITRDEMEQFYQTKPENKSF